MGREDPWRLGKTVGVGGRLVVAHFGRSLARASCWRSRQVLIAGHGGRRTGQMGPAVLVVRLRWRVARGQRLRENRIASKAPDIMRVFEDV
jgi:hypothetical protein